MEQLIQQRDAYEAAFAKLQLGTDAKGLSKGQTGFSPTLRQSSPRPRRRRPMPIATPKK
jgi:hypothetical protein